MSLISLRGAEPIAGYSVTERLGAGGYGEVWKAEAPGGLQKAIKFIYGYLNEEKASRELKALNRVKQIRHPFLLSLERIEVVDGQLLIVTELADSSVKDRCQECRQEGLPGIPRDELLRHLGDAADALDYLSTSGLQHLDVKPENLLLVGGRVKVADFGLVKDIQDRTCSMMGGMTPVYAPPEIFDGRPNARSDQYSLAIVYQEMLTGVLPFPGATAAQLASQHLHSRPRLESLPAADRTVLARALAKNPSERFTTSRAMIDALISAGHRDASHGDESLPASPRPSNGDTASAAGQDTDVAPRSRVIARRGRLSKHTDSDSAVSAIRSSSELLTAVSRGPEPTPEVRDLGPLEVAAEDVGLRPTLFLGIGGTAAHVLKRLRRRLHERFGGRAATPMLQMLLVDTDAAGLAKQSGAADQGGLDPEELLALPLRRPEEYRADSGEILQWLSRRWLYNIPRSLQTEGLRPLGRLALVDHADELFSRVGAALERCTCSQSLAEAEKNTGLLIRDRTPRVFIIASVSGGTGGGMVLDVAYAVRMLLAEMELSSEGICGLLTHCTSRAVQGKDLAIANAYACINELHHFRRSGYPGEPACGIPAYDNQQAPFNSTYFVHLGDRLNDNQFHTAVDELAEYLHLDAATPGGSFLDKCRASDAQPGAELRTLGVCRLGCRQGLSAQVADHLCHHLLSRWAGQSERERVPTESQDGRLKRIASQLITEFELDADALRERCHRTIEQAPTPAALTVLEQSVNDLLAPLLAETATPTAALWQQLTRQVCQALGAIERQADPAAPPKLDLQQALDKQYSGIIKDIERGLQERITAAADEAEVRLAGSQRVVEELTEYLRGLDRELTSLIERLQQQVEAHAHSPPELPAVPTRKGPKAPEIAPLSVWREHLIAIGRLVLDQWAAHGSRRLAQGLAQRLNPISESLVSLRREAQRLAGQFESAAPWATAAGATSLAASDEQRVDHAILAELKIRFENFTSRFEQMVNQELLVPCGGLIRLLTAGEDRLRLLTSLLRSMARGEVTQALKEIDVARLVLGPLDEETAARESLERFVEAAWPRMLACGGAKRLLLLMPPCATADKLPGIITQHRLEAPSMLLVPGGDLVACYEAEQLPLAAVAASLVRDDPQYAAAAHRLHTRTDIEWSSL